MSHGGSLSPPLTPGKLSSSGAAAAAASTGAASSQSPGGDQGGGGNAAAAGAGGGGGDRTKGVGEAASKLHASAALVSLGSFLRTSIEGLPRLGVIGAPEIASRHMRQDPHLTRRGLLATVYRYSAMVRRG